VAQSSIGAREKCAALFLRPRLDITPPRFRGNRMAGLSRRDPAAEVQSDLLKSAAAPKDGAGDRAQGDGSFGKRCNKSCNKSYGKIRAAWRAAACAR
jgi:hypothetical protein